MPLASGQMTKSFFTNVIAALIVVVGLILNGPIAQLILTTGLFSLAGGITNWLAVHMLFEKVPGLYGSGVISARFEDFKAGIHTLIMEQFFSEQNLDRFFAEMVTEDETHSLDFTEVIETTDLTPVFDGLVETIMSSSFGGMLSMMGGQEAITPLKDPFLDKMRLALNDVAHSDSFQKSVRKKLSSGPVSHDISSQIEAVVNARLDELTPQLVKEIIQTMIREHLGWLVVWGGVFGGLIGLLAGLVAL